MLRTMKDLEGYAIRATDGNIGHVTDFYFDDVAWVIRYLVVDTGTWLSSRKVLISPISIGNPNWAERVLPVSITRQQVQDSPKIDADKPVSRQHETEYLGYYGYPYYWGGAGLWGMGAYPSLIMTGNGGFVATPRADLPGVESPAARANDMVATARQNEDLHLRSAKAVTGYHIQATDGEIGHVQGLLVDEETWAIRYMVVDTSNWWVGHQVLIAPPWIDGVSWMESMVSINLTRKAVKDAPPYDSMTHLDRKHEKGIYKHYGRPGYWVNEVMREGETSK